MVKMNAYNFFPLSFIDIRYNYFMSLIGFLLHIYYTNSKTEWHPTYYIRARDCYYVVIVILRVRISNIQNQNDTFASYN